MLQSNLTRDLLELSSQQRTKRGIDTSFETPTCSNATRKLYNLEAATQPGISLVKPSSTKVTGSRRQTAATSHRNIMSQIVSLLNFNFVRGEWTNKPTNLPEGARLAHQMIKKVTGHPMRPVPTDHIVNYDFTSHYYCKFNGLTNYRDLEDDWVRADSSAVESGSRKTKSIFFDGEEESCGGVMIKWLDCTSASGDLLPIVILIRLGVDEMPDATSPMLFMEIPGLNISSSKDIRANATVGWVVFLKSGSSMIDFHCVSVMSWRKRPLP
jgi:hypothetical protein